MIFQPWLAGVKAKAFHAVLRRCTLAAVAPCIPESMYTMFFLFVSNSLQMSVPPPESSAPSGSQSAGRL